MRISCEFHPPPPHTLFLSLQFSFLANSIYWFTCKFSAPPLPCHDATGIESYCWSPWVNRPSRDMRALAVVNLLETGWEGKPRSLWSSWSAVSWVKQWAARKLRFFDRHQKNSDRGDYGWSRFWICPKFPQKSGFPAPKGRKSSNDRIFRQFFDSPKFRGAVLPCAPLCHEANGHWSWFIVWHNPSSVSVDSPVRRRRSRGRTPRTVRRHRPSCTGTRTQRPLAASDAVPDRHKQTSSPHSHSHTNTCQVRHNMRAPLTFTHS